jgi:hypothetical protein
MCIVIDLADRPKATPTKRPATPGRVIPVAFRELDQLEERLDGLSELPPVEGHEPGDVTLHTDGNVVSIVELVEDDDGHGRAWERVAVYDEATLVDWLLQHRSVRRRLLKRIAQKRCAHDYGLNGRATRCCKCRQERPVKYRQCRARPAAWSGAASKYDRTPICRRRRDHDGPCSWEGDPGCRKNAWGQRPNEG